MPPSTRSRNTLVASFAREEAASVESFGENDVSGVSTPQRTRYMSSRPLNSLKVSELKSKLRELNLPVSGVKLDLIERLEQHQSGSELESFRSTKSKYFLSPDATNNSSAFNDAINDAGLKTPTKSTKAPSKSAQLNGVVSSPRTSPRSAKNSPPKSTSKSPRKRLKIEPGSLNPPQNWERIYSLVTELRSDRTAPVDTDGASALPEKHLGEVVYRFQVLIALMLSSQTKDAVVGETMRALQAHGLTVENIDKTDHGTLNSLIGKVGFHNNKTKFIKQAAEIMLTQYNGDIPGTAEELMTLNGVGPKMAYIVEQIAFDRPPSGIGVDTHMHRSE